MNALVRFLLPLRCLGCGTHVSDPPATEDPEPLCLNCRLRMRAPPAPRCPRCDLPRGTGSGRPATCGRCDDWPSVLERAVAAAVLEPPADALVEALKYGGWPMAAVPMARLMAARLHDLAPGGDTVLVPVPTTPRRRRRRGYNQARRLAEALGRIADLEVVEGLSRRPSGSSQVVLQVDERRANVSGAFVAGPRARSIDAHSHTILVDDVLTTGATAGAAASALRALGATRVGLVAFARALPRTVTVPVAGSVSSIRKEFSWPFGSRSTGSDASDATSSGPPRSPVPPDSTSSR